MWWVSVRLVVVRFIRKTLQLPKGWFLSSWKSENFSCFALFLELKSQDWDVYAIRTGAWARLLCLWLFFCWGTILLLLKLGLIFDWVELFLWLNIWTEFRLSLENHLVYLVLYTQVCEKVLILLFYFHICFLEFVKSTPYTVFIFMNS